MGDITRGALIFTGAAGAAGVAVGVLANRYGPQQAGEAAAPPLVAAARTTDAIPLDVDGPWDDAEPTEIPLQPQQAAPPILAAASVDTIEIRALVNDRELGLAARFACADPQDLPGLGTSGDAWAIQLPARIGATVPPVTMGGPNQPVHILRWSSVWQRDVDRGRSRVETIYPNTIRDMSPSTVLPEESAVVYSPGRAVGNPMSASTRDEPVEETMAEGFGRLTTLPDQRARGRGRHRDGHRNVEMTVPLERGGAFDSLAGIPEVPVAVALWIGADGNRGSRKHFSDWFRCTL